MIWDPQKEDNFDNGLIDPERLQQLQDQFCRASNLYLACLGKKEGVITKSYGTKEELSYIHSLVDESIYMDLVTRMEEQSVESVIEQPLEQKFIRMCAVSTRMEGKTQVVWVVIGILPEYITKEDDVPDCLMTTTEEHMYASVEFLSVMSRQLFDVKINQLIARNAMKRSMVSEAATEEQLKRSNTMTEILRMLESDNGFAELVEETLREACGCLEVNGGNLIRENVEDGTLDMICEYVQNEKYSFIGDFQHLQKDEVPFFTDKSYIVSSDSLRPEEFDRFLERYNLTAAVFFPVEANERVLMYLCFFENEKERIWKNEDIKFLNDVRRVVQSVLVKRIARNSLAGSYASLEEILERSGCGIYVADYKMRSILYMNRRFKDFFSRTIAAGKLEDMVFSEKEMERKQYFEEMYSAEEERWLDARKTEIDWVDGRRVSLCTLYDITDKKVYQKEIENQASNDFLTGLFNRMRCEQDLGRYITKAQSENAQGALLYLDLDDFKHINDGLGHQYGDVLLKAISHSLQRISGISKTCYRTGGDEFMVIVPHSIYSDLERIVHEIISIFTRPWFLKGEDYYCTASMGIVCFPSDSDSVESLIRKADIALLAAKKSGKNRYEYYTDMDAASSYRRLDLEKNMRSAAMDSCKEFEVYYQPIIDGEEGMTCCGAEALVRWNSSALGIISPEDFIPLAEYLGLINPIGEYVLRNAAKRCKYWNDMGHPKYKVNVNLSVVQLLQNDIVKKIAKVVEETRINPENLTLEVTESLAINDMDRMKKILSQIRQLGIKVALDDFGTGYSSLNHIREMPLDIIKIDRCFIEHLGEDDFSNAFVKMVAELASTIGVKVCVEGVETAGQRDIVHGMHIRMQQGYFFGKPMKIEEFEKQYL